MACIDVGAGSWQGWVNSGLMAFFFLVAGLEARREFDMGELRERRRLALPVVVAVGGMVAPVAIYLAINFGRSSASGWGAAMSTDTAFALGVLALAGPGVPDRVRTYMLTFALVDDVAGIVITALAYTGHIDLAALGAGLALLGVVAVARWRGVRGRVAAPAAHRRAPARAAGGRGRRGRGQAGQILADARPVA